MPGIAAVVILVVCACCAGSTALGQSVYRWTDERGVIHFGQDPRAGAHATKEFLPTPAARKSAGEKVKSSGSKSDKKRPAKVKVRENNILQTGPAAREISGRVKNTGKDTAKDVVVVVTVTDKDQNGRCLEEEVPVNPDTLDPGESGTFFREIEHPCLYGNTRIKIRADWK